MNLKTLRKPPKLGESQTMKSNLTIFISCVSDEFNSCLDTVQSGIEMEGSFGTRPGIHSERKTNP